MPSSGPDQEGDREAAWIVRMLRIDLYPKPIPQLALLRARALILALRVFVQVESKKQEQRALHEIKSRERVGSDSSQGG